MLIKENNKSINYYFTEDNNIGITLQDDNIQFDDVNQYSVSKITLKLNIKSHLYIKKKLDLIK